MVDRGVLLNQILIVFGGWKNTNAFPAETKCIHSKYLQK